MRRISAVMALAALIFSASVSNVSAWTTTTPDAISVIQLDSSSTGSGEAIAVDGDGNMVVSGRFDGTIDMDPGSGTNYLTSIGGGDIFLAKYNKAGELLWAKSIGGTNFEKPVAIALDALGNIYVTGEFSGTVDFDPTTGIFVMTSTASSADSFVARYTSAGALEWATSLASDGREMTASIALDSSQNVLLAGQYSANTSTITVGGTSTSLTSTNNDDSFFMKLNTDGSYAWAKKVGNSAADSASAIRVDSSNNIFVLGNFQATANLDPNGGTTNLVSSGQADIYLAKFAPDGTLTWARSFGGTSADDGRGLGLDPNGNAYFTGYFQGTADFDPSSGTSSLVSIGSEEVFIAKVTSDGTLAWAHRFGSTDEDYANAISVDTQGNAFVTGFFWRSAYFGPTAGTDNVVVPNYGVFVVKVNTDGQYQWARGFAGRSFDEGRAIAATSLGGAITTGYFSGTSDFDPGSGTATLTATADNVFVLRLDSTGSAAIDVVAPTVTWISPTSPSTSRTVTFTATFSEPVSGIAASDFTNTGTATGCVFTPSAALATNSITVSVTCTSDGTVVPQLAASSVRDSSFNAGPTAASSATSVTIATTSATPTPSTSVSPTTTVAPSTTVATTPTSVAKVRKTELPSTGSSPAVLVLGALLSVMLGVVVMRRRIS